MVTYIRGEGYISFDEKHYKQVLDVINKYDDLLYVDVLSDITCEIDFVMEGNNRIDYSSLDKIKNELNSLGIKSTIYCNEWVESGMGYYYNSQEESIGSDIDLLNDAIKNPTKETKKLIKEGIDKYIEEHNSEVNKVITEK